MIFLVLEIVQTFWNQKPLFSILLNRLNFPFTKNPEKLGKYVCVLLRNKLLGFPFYPKIVRKTVSLLLKNCQGFLKKNPNFPFTHKKSFGEEMA